MLSQLEPPLPSALNALARIHQTTTPLRAQTNLKVVLTRGLRRSRGVRREGREDGRRRKNPVLERVAGANDATVETALVDNEVVQHDAEDQRETRVEKE